MSAARCGSGTWEADRRHDAESCNQPAPSDESARSGLRVCARCQHQRTRPRPALFFSAELGSAEVLKAQLELLQQERQRAEAEQRRSSRTSSSTTNPATTPGRHVRERRPKGFAFCDTASRIFILMASRRLKSDRFFTTDYNPAVYTRVGLDWVERIAEGRPREDSTYLNPMRAHNFGVYG
jgi:hypothetical protein